MQMQDMRKNAEVNEEEEKEEEEEGRLVFLTSFILTLSGDLSVVSCANLEREFRRMLSTLLSLSFSSLLSGPPCLASRRAQIICGTPFLNGRRL